MPEILTLRKEAMKSTEQMLQEGQAREAKIMVLASLNNMVGKFLMVAAEDEAMDDILVEVAACCNALATKATALVEENEREFQAFQEATAEVDALEAMLQAGGIEQ